LFVIPSGSAVKFEVGFVVGLGYVCFLAFQSTDRVDKKGSIISLSRLGVVETNGVNVAKKVL
jgi:hypothetical protein